MAPRARIIPALAVTLVVLVAGAAALWSAASGGTRFYTDGASVHERASTALPRTVLWQPAHPLDDSVNTPADEYEPKLSADGQTYFFVRGRAGANADIFFRTRSAQGWSPPSPLSAVNTEADELGPEVSA